MQLTQLPQSPAIGVQSQRGGQLDTGHGSLRVVPVEIHLISAECICQISNQTVWDDAFIHTDADPAADRRGGDELRMLLRLLSGKPPTGLEVLVPILMLRLEHPHIVVAALMEEVRQPPAGLDARLVMVQAEADGAKAGVLLQHPEHGVFRCSAQGHIAVFLPASGVAGEEGHQVNGRLKDIEAVAGPGVVKAAPGIAALHVDAEGFAEAVEAALVGVARDAVFILTDEDGVVILSVLEFLTALIQQSSPDKSIDHVPVQKAVLEQIGVHPPHLLTGRGQGKFLFGLFLLLGGGGVDGSLFAAQQTGDGLRVGEIIELLDEGDRTAALLHSVVVPSIAPDGDTVVTGQTVLRPGAD